MKIRPIKTKADYGKALARAEALMDAKPGSPKGDELDVLVTLIEAYEDKHYPFPPAEAHLGDQVPDGTGRSDAQEHGALSWRSRTRV